MIAQQTFRARVIDSKTSKALPYVKVVAPGCKIITNREGEFAMQLQPHDKVRISCVGYETISLHASDLSSQVRMQPYTLVRSDTSSAMIDKMLYKLQKHLYLEFENRKNRKRDFYYHFATTNDGHHLMADAFVKASVTLNLRNLDFIHGRIYSETQSHVESENASHELSSLYINNFLSMGPLVKGVAFLFYIQKPFDPNFINKHVSRSYHLRCDELRSAKGETIYKISMQPRERRNFDDETEIIRQGSLILYPLQGEFEGNLYLSKSNRMLAFDGEVLDYIVKLSEESSKAPAYCKVHVDYAYSNGATEVEKAYCSLRYPKIESHVMMCNKRILGLSYKDFIQPKKASFLTLTEMEERIAKRNRE